MEETIRGIFPFSVILYLLEYDTTKQVKRQKEKAQKTIIQKPEFRKTEYLDSSR
jgi:hypothetical protein